jgi:hypothetical protein
MSKKLSVISLLILLLLLAGKSSHAQKLDESDTRAMVQASFLFQFATNCNWPKEAKTGKFYIGVLGNPSIYQSAKERYGAKPVGSQTLEIVSLTEIPTTQFFHIVFIDKSHKGDLSKAIKELKAKNTLIVTNWEGAIGAGSHINFKSIDGSIRYEMNVAIIEDKKIIPGVKIIQWKVD